MDILDCVRQTRTVRRYEEGKTIARELLENMVDAARLSGSARNGQVLKYMVVTERRQCATIFPLLGWAGYLQDWKGPQEGERPAAYILCLVDKDLLKGNETEAHFDCGIATQSMLMLGAEHGIYGCRIGMFSKNIDTLLNIKEPLSTMLVVALGYPAEQVVVEEINKDGDIKYWRDEKGVHHVPKRSVAEVLVTPDF